jgi:hypothetical protein
MTSQPIKIPKQHMHEEFIDLSTSAEYLKMCERESGWSWNRKYLMAARGIYGEAIHESDEGVNVQEITVDE